MAVISENYLRDKFKKEKNTENKIILSKKDIITPSGRQYINENKIELLYEEDIQKETEKEDKKPNENYYKDFTSIDNNFKPKYISSYDGGYYEEKPEYMTHIRGNKLVYKDDERIIFRGAIDSFQALLLEIQIVLSNTKHKGLLKDLKELLELSRSMLRAEVKEEEIKIDTLFGLKDDELREHSHHPYKYYNTQHFTPSADMGEEVVYLNKLRTRARELEIKGNKAFRNGNVVDRKDILSILNRLSSGIYILMCRVRGGFYE